MSFNLYAQQVNSLEAKEFKNAYSKCKNSILLDVRKQAEYTQFHIKDAILIDWLDSQNFEKEALKLDKNKTIFVYCRSGRRSLEACKFLIGKGYNVVNLLGGIVGWQNLGLEVGNGS